MKSEQISFVVYYDKWLNRRSQRKSYAWRGFEQVLDYFQLEKPRITEQAYAS